MNTRKILASGFFAAALVAATPQSATQSARAAPLPGARAAGATYVVPAQSRPTRRLSNATTGTVSAKAALANARKGSSDTLFGTTETRSDKFTPFKKWTGAMERAAQEQADTKKFAARFKDWVGFLDGLKGKSKLEQVKAVNSFMNKSQYIQDNKNYGVKDYWASPGEFIAKFGDCEDYSIAKYMALKYLGFDPDTLRVVAVKDMNLKVGHAILAVYLDDQILILDNQIKVVVDSSKIHHYQPVYSINEHYWWRHRA